MLSALMALIVAGACETGQVWVVLEEKLAIWNRAIARRFSTVGLVLKVGQVFD
jgi:hypothetical protein